MIRFLTVPSHNVIVICGEEFELASQHFHVHHFFVSSGENEVEAARPGRSAAHNHQVRIPRRMVKFNPGLD